MYVAVSGGRGGIPFPGHPPHLLSCTPSFPPPRLSRCSPASLQGKLISSLRAKRFFLTSPSAETGPRGRTRPLSLTEPQRRLRSFRDGSPCAVQAGCGGCSRAGAAAGPHAKLDPLRPRPGRLHPSPGHAAASGSRELSQSDGELARFARTPEQRRARCRAPRSSRFSLPRRGSPGAASTAGRQVGSTSYTPAGSSNVHAAPLSVLQTFPEPLSHGEVRPKGVVGSNLPKVPPPGASRAGIATPGLQVPPTATTAAATAPPRGDRRSSRSLCAPRKSGGSKSQMEPQKPTGPSMVASGRSRKPELGSKSPRCLSLRDQPKPCKSPLSLSVRLTDSLISQALCVDGAGGTASSRLCGSSFCTGLWISRDRRARSRSDPNSARTCSRVRISAVAKLQAPPDGSPGPRDRSH